MIKKALSLIIILAWFGFSVFIGQIMYQSFHENQHTARYNIAFNHFAFDVVVIILLGLFTFFWNNLQIFFAYYSLVPTVRLVLLRLTSLNVYSEFNFKNFLITTLLGIWSLRVFSQRFISWRGFPDQDQVYTDNEKKYGGIKRIFYWLWQQPLTGIMNALLISFLTLPLTVFYTRNIATIQAGENYTISEIISYFLIIYGLAIQSVSDLEANIWKNSGNKGVCDQGFRRYLRYPEHYGELSFWLGIWGASVGPFENVVLSNFIYWPIGWVLLLLTISFMCCTMDSKSAKNQKGWSEYRSKVRFGLIPFFRF